MFLYECLKIAVFLLYFRQLPIIIFKNLDAGQEFNELPDTYKFTFAPEWDIL